MTQIIEYTAFIIFSLLLYLVTRWIKHAFSGTRYSEMKLCFSAFYKIVPIYIHSGIQATQSVIFYGPLEISIPGWLTLIIINAHLFCVPTPYLTPRRFLKRKVDPNIRIYK